jgi:leader peptidase (prepilin peptidase)/N-methyltransferase
VSIVVAVLVVMSVAVLGPWDIATRFAGLVFGLAMFGVSLISKGQIGKGDALVLCVTGIGLGFWDNMAFFLISLICACVFIVVRAPFKGLSRKDTLPLVPFLLVGFVVHTAIVALAL